MLHRYEANGSVYMDLNAFKAAGHDYPKLEPSKAKATEAEMAESEVWNRPLLIQMHATLTGGRVGGVEQTTTIVIRIQMHATLV